MGNRPVYANSLAEARYLDGKDGRYDGKVGRSKIQVRPGARAYPQPPPPPMGMYHPPSPPPYIPSHPPTPSPVPMPVPTPTPMPPAPRCAPGAGPCPTCGTCLPAGRPLSPTVTNCCPCASQCPPATPSLPCLDDYLLPHANPIRALPVGGLGPSACAADLLAAYHQALISPTYTMGPRAGPLGNCAPRGIPTSDSSYESGFLAGLQAGSGGGATLTGRPAPTYTGYPGLGAGAAPLGRASTYFGADPFQRVPTYTSPALRDPLVARAPNYTPRQVPNFSRDDLCGDFARAPSFGPSLSDLNIMSALGRLGAAPSNLNRGPTTPFYGRQDLSGDFARAPSFGPSLHDFPAPSALGRLGAAPSILNRVPATQFYGRDELYGDYPPAPSCRPSLGDLGAPSASGRLGAAPSAFNRVPATQFYGRNDVYGDFARAPSFGPSLHDFPAPSALGRLGSAPSGQLTYGRGAPPPLCDDGARAPTYSLTGTREVGSLSCPEPLPRFTEPLAPYPGMPDAYRSLSLGAGYGPSGFPQEGPRFPACDFPPSQPARSGISAPYAPSTYCL